MNCTCRGRAKCAISCGQSRNKKRNRVESTRVVTFKSPFPGHSQTLHVTCLLQLHFLLFLSLSISLGRSHLRFGSCQHLEKLKVAISAAHKFEAALVFKVSCSAEKGEKMHMQMQTSRYAVEQASIYCIPYHTLLLSIAYSQLHLRGMWQQKNRIEIPRCHLRLCFLVCCDTWQIVVVLLCPLLLLALLVAATFCLALV